MVEKHVNLTRN